MSKASAYIQKENSEIPTEYPLTSRPIEMLTKSQVYVASMSTKFAPAFDEYSLYTSPTGSVYASMYWLKEQLVTATYVVYTAFLMPQQLLLHAKQDVWVDMPPLSTEKVVMQAQDMGYGEPLAMLDPLPDD